MTPETVLDIGTQAMKVTALLSAPLLLSALVVGLLVGMLQAATQINEMTLTFVPKLIVVALVILIAGPALLNTLLGFTTPPGSGPWCGRSRASPRCSLSRRSLARALCRCGSGWSSRCC